MDPVFFVPGDRTVLLRTSVTRIPGGSEAAVCRTTTASDVKPPVVGQWGTTPGQNFIDVHLNRVICERDLDRFYIAGPGHGGPALVANTYLESTGRPPLRGGNGRVDQS